MSSLPVDQPAKPYDAPAGEPSDDDLLRQCRSHEQDSPEWAAACEILDQVPVSSATRAAVLGVGKLGSLVARVLETAGAPPAKIGWPRCWQTADITRISPDRSRSMTIGSSLTVATGLRVGF